MEPGRLKLVLVPPVHAPLPTLPGGMRALAHVRVVPVPGVQWQELETVPVRVRRLVLADREGRLIPAKGEP